MQKRTKKVYRYSEAFKQKVVTELEDGDLSLKEASIKYGINGSHTIKHWIKKLGKNHLLCRVVRIQTPDEMDQTKLLKCFLTIQK